MDRGVDLAVYNRSNDTPAFRLPYLFCEVTGTRCSADTRSPYRRNGMPQNRHNRVGLKTASPDRPSQDTSQAALADIGLKYCGCPPASRFAYLQSRHTEAFVCSPASSSPAGNILPFLPGNTTPPTGLPIPE